MDEKIDPVEQIRPSKEMEEKMDLKSSKSMNPGHHGSTPSSTPTMKPSHPSSVDSLHPFLPMDAIESIRQMYDTIDPELIDPLVRFIENQLYKMITPPEAGSSSSEGWLATVHEDIQHAATTIDILSTAAEKFSESDAAVKEIGRIMLEALEGMDELHRALIGVSLAAFATQRYMSSTVNECRELLSKILGLAKDIKVYGEQISKTLANDSKTSEMERKELCNAVVTIVEGAVICCDCMDRGKASRFLLATTEIESTQLQKALQKTNQQLKDVTDFLALCSLQQHWDKHVFLSHSGVQKDFVRELHQNLTIEHVSSFFDADRNCLPLGERFPRLIFKAAETTRIAVLVLSNDFIRSKWPMLELSAFISAIKSGINANLKLLPIFFKISPNEVSLKKDSPEWQKFNVSNETRVQWEEALKIVRSINGLHFRENENEVVFRDEVMKAICRLLGINRRPKLLDFEPVGIEEEVQKVQKLLDAEGTQSALAVIVCGLGGVGKSTVASYAVQSLDWSSTDFKFCWVAIDEKAPDITSHIIKLQQDIINDLVGVKPPLRNSADGRVQIKKALQKQRCLLFIDNVVDTKFVRELLPKDLPSEEQETKLRMIITSREEKVQAELGIRCEVHRVKGLSVADSKTLLWKTILQTSVVKHKNEEDVFNEVAAECKGVPLLLSVFGNHLRGNRDESSYQESYKEVLGVLREGNLDSYRDEDLGTRVMFVYDKIKAVDVKEAFLDVCTYFHGWEWDLVVDILDFSKLEELRTRSLLSKSNSGRVIVHDMLRSMGMKKANLTRFSNSKELFHALKCNLDDFVIQDVKGISLLSEDSLIKITSKKLEAMHKSLRVLMLGDWVKLEGPPCRNAFPNLRYLRLGDISVFPFKDPSKLNKLRVFVNSSKPGMILSSLPSSLLRVSHEVPVVECDMLENLPFPNPCSLKRFVVQKRESVRLSKQLRHPVSVELPKELHLPASLLHLSLMSCKNLPKEIGHLIDLESLDLFGSDLECLPQGFGELKKLKHLNMDYSSKLAFLSNELGLLSSLEALSINCCKNLSALPERLEGLVSLQRILFRECIKLQELPESFAELRIQSLNLHSLLNLNELPNGFGSMILLKDLTLESCDSLQSLPDTFVQLKMLETLRISKCTKLSRLPDNFGRLKCLINMTVEECHRLQELPHGFGALPALETFTLENCNRFVSLSSDFGELTSLETLHLRCLPFMSRIPDGFQKLKKLKNFYVRSCCQLKTFPKYFQNMATLERLMVRDCPELDGAMMEKILKLPNCFEADIGISSKLLQKWKDMQDEAEHQIVVVTGMGKDKRDQRRAMNVALLHGKCLELNNAAHQLMERPSLMVGLKDGKTATVALIMLPINMQSHQHETLKRFVEKVRETAETNGSSKLQIVCARKVDLSAERPTPTEEEERVEKEGIRQILLSLPLGSCAIPSSLCAIPSSECKRVKILTCCVNGYTIAKKLGFFMANAEVEDRKIFENFIFIKEDEIAGKMVGKGRQADEDYNSIQNSMEEKKNKYNSIQNFIISITRADEKSQSECVAGEDSKRAEFMKALKANGINYLRTDNNTKKVKVDDLQGKAIGFILCDFDFFDYVKLQQIYKDLQQKDSNLMWIWIPNVLSENLGHGSYTKLIQCMPWATFPDPKLVELSTMDAIETGSRFVLLDKDGQIANTNAMPLVLASGVTSYPFTQHAIPENFSLGECQSCLEFLLHGMNIVERNPMTSKITFLYVEYPMSLNGTYAFDPCIKDLSKSLQEKSKLQELTQIRGSFEVLYVGKLHEYLIERDIESLKREYEDATQNMRWPSLSFSDMITFWYRCKYLASEEGYQLYKESNTMTGLLHRLAQQLSDMNTWLVLVDNDGPVTRYGEDVLQVILESSEANDGAVTSQQEDVAQMIEESSEHNDGADLLEFHQILDEVIQRTRHGGDTGQMLWESLEDNGDDTWQMYWESLRHRMDLVRKMWHKNQKMVHKMWRKSLTLDAEDVVQMICESLGGEGMRKVKDGLNISLSGGKWSPIVTTVFGEEIPNHPQHPQHPISLTERRTDYICDVCDSKCELWKRTRRRFRCDECDWDMCVRCWITYSKLQVEQLVRAQNN